jgi:hypothetical protein
LCCLAVEFARMGFVSEQTGGGKWSGVPGGYPPARVSRHPKTDLYVNKRPLASLWKGRRGVGGSGVVVVQITSKIPRKQDKKVYK